MDRKKICSRCGKELEILIPPVEEYVDYIFCIKFFGWKLMLLKEDIEYVCFFCRD